MEYNKQEPDLLNSRCQSCHATFQFSYPIQVAAADLQGPPVRFNMEKLLKTECMRGSDKGLEIS